MATDEELEEQLFGNFPQDFFRRVVGQVFMAHEISLVDGRKRYGAPELENVRGFDCRAYLEGYLRDTTEMFPGLEATAVRAEGSNWSHTEIRGGPVILTESSVPTPCALVERAEFRTTLARNNAERLFPVPGLDPPPDAPLYVLLLHSKSHWPDREQRLKFGHLPGSAYLAFPSPDLDSYVHEIDLFRMFSDVVESKRPDDLDGEAYVRYIGRSRRFSSG